MHTIDSFPREVFKKFGYYVYLYLDPDTDEVFYVGKGRHNRAFAHLSLRTEPNTADRIREIRARGREPRIELFAHGLSTEREALRIEVEVRLAIGAFRYLPTESAAIDVLAFDRLTSDVQGWKSGTYGRRTVDQVVAHYSAKEVEIVHPVVLIRINQLFRYGMSDVELYDATRGTWRLRKKRQSVAYALSVFDGAVQEVYKVESWYDSGTTSQTRNRVKREGRYEFVGSIAEEKIRGYYRYRSVRKHFAKGEINPFCYVNI